MTKKPDLRGQKFLSKDIESLARLFRKYGEVSFDDACRDVKTLKSRAPGKPTRTDQNFYIIYLALHQSVVENGLEPTCEALTRDLDRTWRATRENGEKFTLKGLKTAYSRAEKFIEGNPEWEQRAKLFEDLRGFKGPVVPVLVKRK